MKKRYLLTIALAIGIIAFSYAQQMEKLTLIKAGGKVIDAKLCVAPCIYDYDRDGLDDLIIGTLRGKFRFCKNTGTKSTPIYKGFILIQANGKDAQVDNW